MESSEKALDILKWLGLLSFLIIWLYFILKKKDWWEPVAKYLSRVKVYGGEVPIDGGISDEEYFRG